MAGHKSKRRTGVDFVQLGGTLLKANLIGYALTAILILLASFILTYTNLGAGFEQGFIFIAVMLSAALVGFDTAKMEGKKGYKWGSIGGLSYFILFIIISILVGNGLNINMTLIMTLALIAIVSGAVAGMFSVALEK